MKRVLVIGYMHSKDDKRVLRTVNSLSKVFCVTYQYLTTVPERPYTSGNISFVPILWKENESQNPVFKMIKRRKFDEQIIELITRTEFDILYLHHFLPTKPLLPFVIAKGRGKMVVFDIHEYHPQNFLANLPGIIEKAKERVMNEVFRKQIELSDKLIFVSEEMISHVDKNIIQLSDKKVMVLPNYANGSCRKIENIEQIDKKKKEIVFVGKIPRKLREEKQIIKNLIEKGFKFKVIGMDTSELEDIPHTSMGLLPYDKMLEEIAKALFSLVSSSTINKRDYVNHIYSLPNKFFDSLAAGTPVIVKDSFVSMKKIVERLGIGVVIDPTDVNFSVQKVLVASENYQKYIENVEKYKNLFVWDENKEREFIDFIIGSAEI
ncbi:MAG: glycosyl transferase family 1 [Fervidobacterium sp.]